MQDRNQPRVSAVSRLVYQDPWIALTQRGYNVSGNGDGLSFGLAGSERWYGLGMFSSLFINELMAASGLCNVYPLPMWLDYTRSQGYRPGMLAKHNTRLETHVRELGYSTPVEKDTFVEKLYFSNDTVHLGKEMPFMYDLPKTLETEVVDKTYVDGELTQKFREHTGPFFYCLKVDTGPLSEFWRRTLTMEQFSFLHDAEKGVLQISNTLGAAYGLPPAPEHLRMDKICNIVVNPDLVDSWGQFSETPAQAEKEKKKTTKKPKAKKVAKSDKPVGEDQGWKEALDAFLKDPSQKTYQERISKGPKTHCVKDKYTAVSKDRQLCPDRFSRKESRSLRDDVFVATNPVDPKVFAEKLIATGKSPLSQLIFIVETGSMLRWNDQGQVFYAADGQTPKKEKPKEVAPADGSTPKKEKPKDAGDLVVEYSDETEV
jgi:hypothetical protein